MELPRKCCFKASRNNKMEKPLPSNNDIEATFCQGSSYLNLLDFVHLNQLKIHK